jgi:hypothetical protein
MRYHRFDFPDLPLEAFKHYGDRRIKPQSGSGGIVSTVSDIVSAPFQPQTSGGGGGGGGGFLGGFLGNPLGTLVDTASNIVNGASDTLHQVTAPILDPVSDVIHDVSTTVAKSPILNTAAYAVMVANGVPPMVASGVLSANAGASPENIVKNMALAGIGSEIASQVAPEISKLSESQLFGQAAGQAAGSAATAAVAGRDPLAAALTSFVSSGANVATGEIVKDIPGFDNLPRAAQDSVRSAVNASLQGKDPTMAIVNRAMNAGVQEAVKYGSNIFTGSVTNPDQFDFGVNQGTVDKLAELQAREVEAEDAARAAAEQRLAEEENIRQIEAARAEQGATDTTINTEPAVDESYLSNLSPADLERYKAMQAGIDTVPDIKPQDLGISQESIDSYERTQQENADAGKLPSQWVPNQDGSGTSTMVHDDGSTTTIDDKGDIVYTTEAPPGSLISDKVTDETFTKLSTTQKSTALDMVKSGIPMNQAVKYVNSMGQTVSQPTQQVQQTQQTSSGTALSPLSPQYLTSTANKQGFVNPLSTYQRMVASDTAPLQPNPTQDTVQVSQGNVMPDYYSYGQNQSIDDILGITAKEGGLVTPLMAKGGSVQKYAEGGLSVPMMNHGGKMRGDFRHGAHVAGPGDGQSDDIPAMLADGEFVFPADVVSALGNGSTKAGSQKLYDMMHSIRDRARSKGPKDLPPPALKSPLDYLSKKSRS